MPDNPLSAVQSWDLAANGYRTEVMPVFEKWTRESIERVKPQKQHKVIDIAAGPGTVALMVAPLVKEVAAFDFSPEMIALLEREARAGCITNVRAEICDCQSLPCRSNYFDIAFSQFGLMFFPDRQAGFREAYRVLKPGGRAVVYSWAPISDSPAMQMMMEALKAGFPEAGPSEEDPGAIVKGLDDLPTFQSEMTTAGFTDVSIEAIAHGFPITGPDEFWESMVRGSAPIVLLKNGMDLRIWKEKEKVAKQFIRDNLKGARSLSSKAYLGIGRK